MRRKISLAALAAALGLALALGMASCENGSDSPLLIVYSVKYSTERGSAPTAISVFSGMTLAKSQLPELTADGYDFGGWFDGKTQAVAGKYIVAKNVTLTAKWTAAPTPGPSDWDGNLSNLTAESTAAYATAANGVTITGMLGVNVKVSIAAGATVTLKNAFINSSGAWTSGEYAGLNCLGDATIVLEGISSIKGFDKGYPGIHVPQGKTLTIRGSGSLGVSPSAIDSSAGGAGIGGGKDLYCGNIIIEGGTITAAGGGSAAGIGSGTKDCGNITITGGSLAVAGGKYAVGIGGAGYTSGVWKLSATCGTITIAKTVTRVIAKSGFQANYGRIGKSFSNGTCGAIKFGDATVFNGSTWIPDPLTAGNYGGLTLAILKTSTADDTWMLTPTP